MMRFLLQKLGFSTLKERGENKSSTVLWWVFEELMFWGGFFALLAGSGWVSWLGGMFILISIVIVFVLLA